MAVRPVTGLVALAATVSTVVPAGAAVAAPTTSTSAAAPVAASVLPTPGSWAVGYSAVVRGGGQSSTTASLQLIGPNGGVVKTLGTGLPTTPPTGAEVQDVQHDLGRVLTSQLSGSSTVLTVWDVAAGTRKSFSLKGDHVAGYLAQGGLVTVQRTGSTITTTRRTYAGTLTRTFQPLAGGYGETELSPGGTLLMQRTRTGMVLRRAIDGSVVKSVARPKGMAYCQPLGLWGQGYVKMYCDSSATDRLPGRVYAVSTTKGSPIAVSPSSGYWDAWPTTRHRSFMIGDEETVIGRLAPSGPVAYFDDSYRQVGLGAHGSSIWVWDYLNGWMRRKDVVSGRATGVAGPGTATGGWVFSARLVDTVS